MQMAQRVRRARKVRQAQMARLALRARRDQLVLQELRDHKGFREFKG